MLADRYGFLLTTTSVTAAERYVEGVDRLLALDAGGEAELRAALAEDDRLAVAHAALGFLLAGEGRQAEARGEAARGHTVAMGATRRERQHVEALAAAIEGEGTAIGLIAEHLDEFTRDAPVLYQGMILISSADAPGTKEALLRLCQRAAPAYGDDWWFLSALGLAHQELGGVAEGMRLAERSLSDHPRNGHAVHCLAHCHYETGEHEAGIAFLDEWLRVGDVAAPSHSHLSWHLALHHLALDQLEAVMGIYTRSIDPAFANGADFVDASSLLWRLHVRDLGVSALPWADVSALASRVCPEPGRGIRDVHAALAHAGAGDEVALSALVDGLRRLDRAGHPTAGSVVLPLVEGIIAFAAGDYPTAIRRIEAVEDKVELVGGSRVQRELVEATLLAAYLQTGHPEAAQALLLKQKRV